MPKLIKDIQKQIKAWKEEQDGLKSASSGIADPWKDFEDRLEKFQKEMIEQVNYRRKDDFIYEIEDLAKEFKDVIYLHGHAFDFDYSVLNDPPRTVHSIDGFAEWSVGKKRTLDDLDQSAVEIVTSASTGAGQLTEAMYNELYQQQAVWPQLLDKYIEKIQGVLRDRLSIACHKIWPPAISEDIEEFLKVHAGRAFGEKLKAKASQITMVPEPNGTLIKGAMDKAWQVEVRKMVDGRIHEILRIDRARGTPKKDHATIAAKAKQEAFSPNLVVAKQAIAVMQAMYLEHIDEIKPAWSARQIITDMAEFFRTFSASVKSKTIYDEINEIYGIHSKEDPKVAELGEQIIKYEGCLAKLKAL